MLARFCFRHGQRVSRNALWAIVLPVVVFAGLAAGIVKLQVMTDPEQIWVPPGSMSAEQEAFFNAAFDPFYRIEQVMFTLKPGAVSPSALDPNVTVDEAVRKNVLVQEFLLAAVTMEEALRTSAASDGTVLDDVCFKPIPNQGCIVESPTSYWQSNRTLIEALNATSIQAQLQTAQRSDIGVPVVSSIVLGGITCRQDNVPGFDKTTTPCGECGYLAEALVVTLLLMDDSKHAERAARWEKDVFLKLASSFHSESLQVSYMAQRSVQDEIAVVAEQNRFVIVISYVAMFVYVALALGKPPHPVRSRVVLGLQGIVIVALSVAAALGIVSLAGMPITMIVTEVVPFLILAIGVDNMFILVKAVDRRSRRTHRTARGLPASPASRKAPSAAQTPFSAGGAPAFTPASAGDGRGAGAGGLSVNVSLPGMALSAPLMAGDEDDDADDLDDVGTPMVGADGSVVSSGGSKGLADDSQIDLALAALGTESVDDLLGFALAEVGPTITAAAFGEVLAFGVGAATRIPALQQFCCVAAIAVFLDFLLQVTWFAAAVSVDQRRQRDARVDCVPCVRLPRNWALPGSAKFWGFVLRGEYVRYVVEHWYAPLLEYTLWRVLVLSAFAFFLGGSLWASTRLRLGLEQQLAMPDGSYMVTFFDQNARLGEAGPPVYVVLQNVDYENPATAHAVQRITEGLGALASHIEPPVYSWYGTFLDFETNTTWDALQNNALCTSYVPDFDRSAPFAERVFQFAYVIPITSQCCQDAGYCSAQFAQDIRFLWGPALNQSAPSSMPPVLRSGVPTRHVLRVETDPADPLGRRPLRAEDAAHFHPDAAPVVDRATGRVVARDVVLVPRDVLTSRLRTQHTALRNQEDFISAMQATQAALSRLASAVPTKDPASMNLPRGALPAGRQNGFTIGNDTDAHTQWLTPAPTSDVAGAKPLGAFAYSLTYVYYEQYDYIRGVALQNFLLAMVAIFMALVLVTSPAVAAWACLMVACTTIDIVGFVWALNPRDEDNPLAPKEEYGVDINAVSVVNVVMASGLAVEFCVHVASAFALAHGTHLERARKALVEMGSSVVTGITLTKLVGVLVLAWAPSMLFRLYYFRMYLGIIVFGVFHGLIVLPVILSICGPPQLHPSPSSSSAAASASAAAAGIETPFDPSERRYISFRDDDDDGDDGRRRGAK
jgi:hypothetical protein